MDKLDINNLNQFEKQFIEVYGLNHFYDIFEYIQNNEIMDFYMKDRNTAEDLLQFGFHYGLVSLVAFCYCKLKVSVDILETISKDFKIINSDIPETLELDNHSGRYMFRAGVPIIHSPNARDGMMIATWDKFTPYRQKCFDYLVRMKRFSKCKMEPVNNGKLKYTYTIVDKYIDGYKLLDVC